MYLRINLACICSLQIVIQWRCSISNIDVISLLMITESVWAIGLLFVHLFILLRASIIWRDYLLAPQLLDISNTERPRMCLSV